MITLPRNAQIWAPQLLRNLVLPRPVEPVTHVWLSITDHYEPYWKQASDSVAMQRVEPWTNEWPRIASRHRDSFGRNPRYTFFYPAEEYHPAPLDALAAMTRAGTADVEVHLHHDGEGEAHFREVMGGFVATLRERHGLLREVGGKAAFAFIHGNWALDNSHPAGRFCGLDNELTLLRELGCYADFTMPAAPSPCQTAEVNSIYWAVDDPAQPKSHDRGTHVVRNGGVPADALLMVQGPLTLRQHQRRAWAPSVEVGELTHIDPATPHRVRRWLSVCPQVGGHQFVKLHTHGAQDHIAAALLGGGLDQLFSHFGAECTARGMKFGYASAWECSRLIHEIAEGRDPMAAIT